MKKAAFTYLILLLTYAGFSQNMYSAFGFWHLRSVSGEVNIKELYRQQESRLKNLEYDLQKSSHLSGGINLRTNSYVWHPSFLLLDLDIDYNPQSKQEQYMVIPDYTEVRTMRKYNLGATFFDQKFITIRGFVNRSQDFNNRENLSNLKTNSKKRGGSISLKNKFMPLSVNFYNWKWDQLELLTGRSYINEQSNLQGRISKSFIPGDKHELSISHDNYFSQEANLFQVRNRINNIILTNNTFFDKQKNHSFSSRIFNYRQKGSNDYERFEVNENILMKLPKKFSLSGNYQFTKINQLSQRINQHRATGSLRHQLFLSLETNLFYEYENRDHTVYRELNKKPGINIKYTKKIPTQGRLNISYRYYKYRQGKITDPVLLSVINEEYILSDGQIVILDNTLINIETVIVKDETGTIIYQPYLDYILIERNKYIEIQRFPGGRIPDGAKVYVDYIAVQEGSYNYDENNSALNINVSLFSRLIDIYYRKSVSDYNNIKKSDLVTLDYINQDVYGFRVNLAFISGGVEFDNYQSSIIPYKMKRYFILAQKKFGEKIILSLNGNSRDYRLINEKVDQNFSDLSGKFAYQFNSRTKLNFDVGYRKQTGPGLDLDLVTSRTEFVTVYGKLFIKVSFELYRRNYLGEKVNFVGGNIQFTRKF